MKLYRMYAATDHDERDVLAICIAMSEGRAVADLDRADGFDEVPCFRAVLWEGATPADIPAQYPDTPLYSALGTDSAIPSDIQQHTAGVYVSPSTPQCVWVAPRALLRSRGEEPDDMMVGALMDHMTRAYGRQGIEVVVIEEEE